jgi:hypothetical protein
VSERQWAPKRGFEGLKGGSETCPGRIPGGGDQEAVPLGNAWARLDEEEEAVSSFFVLGGACSQGFIRDRHGLVPRDAPVISVGCGRRSAEKKR